MNSPSTFNNLDASISSFWVVIFVVECLLIVWDNCYSVVLYLSLSYCDDSMKDSSFSIDKISGPKFFKNLLDLSL